MSIISSNQKKENLLQKVRDLAKDVNLANGSLGNHSVKEVGIDIRNLNDAVCEEFKLFESACDPIKLIFRFELFDLLTTLMACKELKNNRELITLMGRIRSVSRSRQLVDLPQEVVCEALSYIVNIPKTEGISVSSNGVRELVAYKLVSKQTLMHTDYYLRMIY